MLAGSPVPADGEGHDEEGKPDAPEPPVAGNAKSERNEEERFQPGVCGDKRHRIEHPSDDYLPTRHERQP